MLRCAFFDLDGTLLNNEKQIPSSARQAILRCRALGVRTYIVTARSPRLHKTLGWTEAEFALFDGAIHSNGATIRQGEELVHCYLNPEAVHRALERVRACPGAEMSLHMPQEDHAFTFEMDEKRLERWQLKPENVHPINEATISRTLKALIYHGDLKEERPPLPAELAENIAADCQGLARVLVTDQGRTIQLVPLEAGKLAAVERIRKQLGIAVDEVSVFGDDLNDLEMITFYPRSVAMGNGHEQVKAAAGFVSASNEEDGIAVGLAWAMGMERCC